MIKSKMVFPVSALTAAMMMAFSPAHAELPDEVTRLSKPESTVDFGLVMVDRDNAYNGQYSGLHDAGVYPNANVALRRRDDESGRWLRFDARNLGLETREMRFEHEVQGQWRYFLDYNRTLHHEPLRPSSRLTGMGTNQQNATGLASPRQLEFETKRDILGVGFDKDLGNGLAVQVRFRNDEKRGDRMHGVYGESLRILFAAEPIDSTIQQWDTVLNFVGDRLQLSGGYSGSSYHNQYSQLTVQHNLTTPATSITQGLPPDNSAHQLFVSGAYQASPTTRGNFKASFGRALQNDRFFAAPNQAGNTRTDLGGEVDTTIVHLGLSSRVATGLSINGNVRYENRDDKTPTIKYIPSSTSRTGFNVTHSPEILTGKLEAGYQLPMDFRLTGGIEYEARERSMPTIVSVRYRSETSETGYRLELRRSLGETLGGSVSYLYSERTGSSFVPTGVGTITDHIDPIHWGDRERDKWRVSLDWTPLESLSVQMSADDARDRYPGGPLGRDSGKNIVYSVDATYALSDDWQASAWFTQDDVVARQQQQSGSETWSAHLRTLGNALGLGVRGKPTSKLSIGADLQHSRDRAEYDLQASTGSLPDILYKRTMARAFADYALQANAGVRVDLLHERLAINDWTWATTGVLFADGTTVLQEPTQSVSFVGVSGYYRWW